MADLTARLKAVQGAQQQEAKENLNHLTLADLEGEIITFGDVHQGRTYQQAWSDTEWVKFMTSRYRRSTKPAHVRFLRYVELKVEEPETQMGQLPIQPKKGYVAPKPKRMATSPSSSWAIPSGANTVICSQDGDGDVASETEMYEAMITNVQLENHENIQALQTRMLSMENALQRVISHLETSIPPANHP